tara:strand:+ start:844 stop:1350 length:507 start_codon:yes stop_codon:yes gene_type:complete
MPTHTIANNFIKKYKSQLGLKGYSKMSIAEKLALIQQGLKNNGTSQMRSEWSETISTYKPSKIKQSDKKSKPNLSKIETENVEKKTYKKSIRKNRPAQAKAVVVKKPVIIKKPVVIKKPPVIIKKPVVIIKKPPLPPKIVIPIKKPVIKLPTKPIIKLPTKPLVLKKK